MVFSVRMKPDGSIDQFKATLVAKSFAYRARIDHKETFSPIVKSAKIHCVLSIAIMQCSKTRQMDVNNAFLHD